MLIGTLNELLEVNPVCTVINTPRRRLTGAKTVPRVFVNGNCIGGGDDTAALAANGKLAKMLA